MVIGVAMNRDRRSFSERDRALLELLRPHLTHAHARLHQRLGPGPAARLFPRGARLLAPGKDRRVLRGEPARGPAPLIVAGDRGRLTVREAAADSPRALLVLAEERAATAEQLRSLGLTRRQSEVLHLLARGASTERIAAELFISPQTVRKHLEHIYRRLGVHTREAAVRMAREAGRTSP
jgi:DNA-binding CsgD family transcriptional regulator